jgi:hypothetical protein
MTGRFKSHWSPCLTKSRHHCGIWHLVKREPSHIYIGEWEEGAHFLYDLVADAFLNQQSLSSTDTFEKNGNIME